MKAVVSIAQESILSQVRRTHRPNQNKEQSVTMP